MAVVSEDSVLPERAAQELTARAGVLQDTMAVHHGLLPEAALHGRPADGVLAAAGDAWLATDPPPAAAVGELPGSPTFDGRARWLRLGQGRSVTEVCLLAADLPGTVTVQLLLLRAGGVGRPGEAVAVVSRRADPRRVAKGVQGLRDRLAILAATRDTAAFFAALRGGWWQNVLDSTQMSRGLDGTSATFSALAGPGIATAVAEEWLAFHAYVERELQPPGRPGPAAPAYPHRRTTLGVRLSADWAWAAVQHLVETVEQVGWLLTRLPEVWQRVSPRHTEAMQSVGDDRERVLGPVRDALLDKRSVLRGQPYRTLWRRLGIGRVAQVELDALEVGLRGRLRRKAGAGSLTVQLLPTWSAGDGPAVQSLQTADRVLIAIDVAADPQRVRHDFWTEVARAAAVRYSVPRNGGLVKFGDGGIQYVARRTPRCSTADMIQPPPADLAAHTAQRMIALAGQYERIAGYARWLNQVRREAGLPPGVAPE